MAVILAAVLSVGMIRWDTWADTQVRPYTINPA